MKGRHTKPNIWDRAARLKLIRDGEKLDPGVNYFVAMLNQLKLPTIFSCEGHPNGFYVAFVAFYPMALKIRQCGFFSVELEGQCHWSIRITHPLRSNVSRVDLLRWAAEAWEKKFGGLKLGSIRKNLNIKNAKTG